MEAKILMLIFFLGGLLSIGVVVALFSKYFTVHTIADSGTAKGIIIWGCAIATLWLVFGGIGTIVYLVKP